MTNSRFFTERTLNIAHRGARDTAPENTIAAFELALAAGADGIELDVCRCLSGEVVVLHDDTIDRTTRGSGLVAELSYATLKEIDAGSWFSPAFGYERIPLLCDVLDAVGGKTRINIEIKGRSWRSDGIERDIAKLVQDRRLENSILISSFNPWALARMKRAAPSLPLALLYSPNMPCYLRRGQARHWIRPQALHPEHTLVDDAYIEWAHRHGWRVQAWTVNDPDEMRRLIKQEVDGIITDHPALLARILGEMQ